MSGQYITAGSRRDKYSKYGLLIFLISSGESKSLAIKFTLLPLDVEVFILPPLF